MPSTRLLGSSQHDVHDVKLLDAAAAVRHPYLVYAHERLAGLELLLHQRPRGSNEHNFALRPTEAAAVAAAKMHGRTSTSGRVGMVNTILPCTTLQQQQR
jgi:hypothetical protein